MEIIGKKVILRDYRESDIEDHVRWNTTETEWKKWDTPWVRTTVFDEAAYRDKMNRKCQKELSSQQIRFSFEICCFSEMRQAVSGKEQTILGKEQTVSGKEFSDSNKGQEIHIGWMNAYTINRSYEPTDADGDIAIGIDIPEPAYRGQGYGKEAFSLFMNYLRQQGYRDLYTQTWSGNEGMIKLAKSLGFTLCARKNNIWTVDGTQYDGLTFVY